MERTLTVSCPGLAIVLGAVVLLACGGGSDYCRQDDHVYGAEICYRPDPRDCRAIPGCVEGPACIGRNCADLTREQCAEKELFCTWVESLGCRPVSVRDFQGCLSFKDPESCATRPYCVWDVGCDGDPERLNCADLDKEECDREWLECDWHDSDDSNEMSPWGIIGL